MYAFVTGPLAWFSFGIFIIGMAYKVIMLIRLAAKKDRVVFNHFSLPWSLKSIIRWLLPFGSRSMREKPVFTLMTFAFHLALLAIPLFLRGHNVLWELKWDMSLWSMPERMADFLTLLFILIVIGMFLRRMAFPDVRVLTTGYDIFLLAIVAAPFVTGYLATHHWFDYQTMLILHILCGEIMLVAIPLTKLSHMVLFFLTRAHLASEMGQRRGTVSW